MKALILEFKISKRDWVYLVPLIQSSINHSPVPSLANKAPIEIFTGLDCPSPLDLIFAPDKASQLISGDLNSPDVASGLQALRESIRQMHKEVLVVKEKQTIRNKKKNVNAVPANFSVGDYVLRSRVDENKHPQKLLVTWVGPYRVIKAEELYFVIQDLVTGAKMEVHPSRMKFYADGDLNVTKELLEHVAAQETRMAVRAIVDHRFNKNKKQYELKVSWRGLESIEDSWEDFSSIVMDVPIIVRTYVASTNDSQLKASSPYHQTWKLTLEEAVKCILPGFYDQLIVSALSSENLVYLHT